MADAAQTPKKPIKAKVVVDLTAKYVKNDGESSMRRLLTVDQHQPGTLMALDVSALGPEKIEEVRQLFQGYQEALAAHMSGFLTFAEWATARGNPGLQFKSFKIDGLKDVAVR